MMTKDDQERVGKFVDGLRKMQRPVVVVWREFPRDQMAPLLAILIKLTGHATLEVRPVDYLTDHAIYAVDQAALDPLPGVFTM